MTNRLQAQSLIAKAIINEFAKVGIRKFFVSPGSRSTLLAIAICELADSGQVSFDICTDERSAAFKCLGFSKCSASPAALLCTSGSSVANYFPAIVEADRSHIPMIVITADRPDELQDNGNNQTIKQTGIYGSYAKFSAEIDCSPDNSNIPHILGTVDFAVYSSKLPDAGVVHLNCKFCEPFFVCPESQNISSKLLKKINSEECFTRYLTDLDIDDYSFGKTYSKPLFVFGENSEKYRSFADFAAELKIPVFADIMSGFRGCNSENVIKYYDEIIGTKDWKMLPDAVFYFGEKIISKKLMMYINDLVDRRDADLLIINDSRSRFDPFSNSRYRITASPEKVRKMLDRIISGKRDLSTCVQTSSLQAGNLSEELVRIVAEVLDFPSNLFLGNSLTIRLFDQFFFSYDVSKVRLFFNRGTSGIDGNIATVAGIASASKKFTLGIIGDLTAFHDLNSLIHLRHSSSPICLVIINNNGGGIFRKLPVNESEYFEQAFLTPLNISFEKAAEMFSLDYFRVSSAEELSVTLKQATGLSKSSVIEMMV